jgi:hypothetical protein
VKYFQNEPKWPEIPEHLRESAEKRHKYPSGFMSEALPLLVEPRLRAEAVEYLRQVEQWKAQHEEWSKGQPYSFDEREYRYRMFDGPWLTARGGTGSSVDMAYKELADAGADEATLRREAAIVYELDRMRSVVDAKERDAAERMRVEAEKLRPKATVKIGDSIFRAHVGIDYAKGPDRTVVTKHEPSPFDFGPCTGCGKLTMNSGASGKRCWYCQYKPNTARLSAYIWALPEAATPDATVLPPAEGSAYTATGDRLDALGAMVRVFRDPMQSDEDYRATLIRYTGWAQ